MLSERLNGDLAEHILEGMRGSVEMYEVLTGDLAEGFHASPYVYTLIQSLIMDQIGLDRAAIQDTMLTVGPYPIVAVVDPDILNRPVENQWEVVS